MTSKDKLEGLFTENISALANDPEKQDLRAFFMRCRDLLERKIKQQDNSIKELISTLNAKMQFLKKVQGLTPQLAHAYQYYIVLANEALDEIREEEREYCFIDVTLKVKATLHELHDLDLENIKNLPGVIEIDDKSLDVSIEQVGPMV